MYNKYSTICKNCPFCKLLGAIYPAFAHSAGAGYPRDAKEAEEKDLLCLLASLIAMKKICSDQRLDLLQKLRYWI